MLGTGGTITIFLFRQMYGYHLTEEHSGVAGTNGSYQNAKVAPVSILTQLLRICGDLGINASYQVVDMAGEVIIVLYFSGEPEAEIAPFFT